MSASCLEREIDDRRDAVGAVRFKVARRDGRDAQRRAGVRRLRARWPREHGVPVKDVQAAAIKAWLDAAPRSDSIRDHVRAASTSPPRSTTSTAGRTWDGLREDHRRRHRPLQAARAASTTHFVMGNDEHSQNVFRKAREQGLDPLAYCDQMETEFREVWARLDISFDDFIRTTEPRHQARVQELVAAHRTTPATSTKASTRAGTASAARRSSRRRISSTASARSTRRSRTGSRRRTTSSGSRSISEPLLDALRRASRVHPAGHPPQRDPAAARRRPRGHLDQPRRAVVGHPAAVRSVERRLRLVRRADQLRRRRSATAPTTRCSRSGGRPTCTSIGKDITRFHSRRLAGDADERGAAAAAAGLRPRLGALQGPADEQVARHRRRSARGRRRGSAPIRCGCI